MVLCAVLFLGAGASEPAGYPLAAALLSAIQAFVGEEREEMLRAYWKSWASWRNKAEGIEREILFSANPEVVLSLPDLYEAALQASDIGHLKEVFRRWKAEESTEEDLQKYKERLKSEERKKLRGRAAGPYWLP
jgi:hypothetical protein